MSAPPSTAQDEPGPNEAPAIAGAPLVVCLGASADCPIRDAISRHLATAQAGRHLRFWHPGLLSAGADPQRTTRQQLREAALVLLLLSDAFYSDAVLQPLRPALDQLPPERVVPVLARAVAYQLAGDGLARRQTLPRDGRPLHRRDGFDDACVALVQEVMEALARLGPRPAEAAAPSLESPHSQAAGATYDPRWYVPREREERSARRRLGSGGLPIVLQGPHLFGKSWLLEHLLSPLRDDPGQRLVELNLAALSEAERGETGALRLALGERLLAGCGLPGRWLEQHLGPGHEPLLGFSRLVQRVLATAETPLCLSMDRADELPEPVRTTFYKQLRVFIDEGVRAPWSRLRLVLCISTTPSELQPDISTSPFNGAHCLVLDELSDAQVEALLARYGLSWSAAERAAVRAEVGGHPYLLRLMMDEAADNGTTVNDLLGQDLPALDGYLARLDRVLSAELRAVLQRVKAQPDWQPTQSQYWRLHQMGLMDRERGTGRVKLRCARYQRLLS